MLGPLLFNVFTNDLLLFMVKSELADDSTLFSCDQVIKVFQIL